MFVIVQNRIIDKLLFPDSYVWISRSNSAFSFPIENDGDRECEQSRHRQRTAEESLTAEYEEHDTEASGE